MEHRATGVALGGAALLSLVLSPLGQRVVNHESPTLRNHSQLEVVTETQQSKARRTLLDDDTGPWYALCREFQNTEVHIDKAASELEHEDDARIDEDTVEVIRKHNGYDEKLAVSEHPLRRLSSCIPDVSALASRLQVLIATVPDPLMSHLGLDFDRYIEAIQHAAGLRSFDFERYWLPWKISSTQSSDPSGDGSKMREARGRLLREDQPGLLIFRKRNSNEKKLDEWLLVFLVGETPTAGVNRLMLTNTLAATKELNTILGNTVSVAGPNFSASYSALADVIVEGQNFRSLHFHFVSPSSSAAALIRDFKERLNLAGVSYTYSALEMRTCRAVKNWHSIMRGLGYRNQELAIIGEDESAYGTEVAASDHESQSPSQQTQSGHLGANDFCGQLNVGSTRADFKPSDLLHLQFPRDLSSLRNAAEAQLQPADSDDSAIINVPRLSVPLSLNEEQSNDRDSPPAFAGTQSAARIDRALQNLVSGLRTHRIQGLFLTATNPLDLIFLLDYLHRCLPDVRLATFGADEFMLGRPKSVDLSGTLVITGMPLLPDRTVSLAGNRSARISFPSTNSEGMFLAISDLLFPERSITDSDGPTEACASVSVVGKSEFRPLNTNHHDLAYPCNGPRLASLVA